MNAAALTLDESQVIQEIGDVVAAGSGSLRVATAKGAYEARRAFSCLVEPIVGDRVIVATSSAGEAFVLAVLERESDAPATLKVDGDLDVQVPAGRLKIVASEGMDLVSRAAMRLVGKDLELHARRGKAFFDSVALLGDAADVSIQRLKGVYGLVDNVAERVSQKLKRSYRFIEEMDVTRAKQVDLRAEDNVHLRGKNTLMSAEVLVKMDAEQIHLG